MVGVRTTGGLDDLAFDAVLMFPESCGAGTDGSSGSIVSTSVLVLMLANRLAKVVTKEWVGLVSNVTVVKSINMNNERPTESTPLLVSSNSSRAGHALPSIAEGLDSVRARGPRDFNFPERSFPNFAAQTAYQLLIYLQWRATTAQNTSSTNDIWEFRDQNARLSLDLKALDDGIISLWDDFVKDYRTSKEIQDVLWLRFPVDSNSHRFVRGMSISAASESASKA